MRSKAARCPSSRDLERAYWTGDARVRLHADGCARCAPEWQEIAALVEGGRAVATPPSRRREEIRTALLAGLESTAPARRPRRVWLLAAPVAAAAAAIVWWAWPARPQPEVLRGQVLAHADAHYMIAAPQPDEIVRLVDGTLTVEVAPLRSGERFRVVTGDAEIDVKGTAFDVSAADDRLTSVRVVHGRVEVRQAGTAARTLSTGEAWQPVAASAAPAEVAAPDAEVSPPASPADAGPPARIQTGAPRPAPARSAAQQAFDDGWRAIRTRDFDAAAAAFERAAAGRGAVAEDAAYWRAVALARAGDADGAIRAFDDFLLGHPASTRAGEARVMAGWLCLERGDRARAARHFRAAAADPTPRVRESAARGLAALRRSAR